MNSKTILIIDTEENWIQFVATELPKPKFSIHIATSIDEVRDALSQRSYSFILASSRCLDIVDAIEHDYPGSTVVVTTIHPTIDEAQRAYDKGAVRYLPKSWEPDALEVELDSLNPKGTVPDDEIVGP